MRAVLPHNLERPSSRSDPYPDPGQRSTAGAKSGKRSLRLDPWYTFDSFVVGDSNQMAHAAAFGICRFPGQEFNPLFLYGESGLGKTHLLQAIAHEVLRTGDLRVVYRSAEDFMNDFTRSLRDHHMESFRRFYREDCDLLLLDDIQFIGGKEQTQQEFFHTFEALLRRGCHIVITCDRPPREIDKLDERLKTRFSWGLLADIQLPGLETRIAILQNKAEMDNVKLGKKVALFLAEHFRNSIRDLEGALHRIGAYSRISGRPMSVEFAREVLKDHLPRSRKLSIEDVIRLVAEHYCLRASDLTGKHRHRLVARPRQVAMYLSRNMLDCSFPEIGRAFSRDHTTVMSACSRIESLFDRDEDLCSSIDELKRNFRG